MTNPELIALGLLIGLILYSVRLLLRLKPRQREQVRRAPVYDPDTHIVVDGSNIMYWSGDPSVLVLNRVLLDLQEKGRIPIVYFDANVGYKLWGKYMNAEVLGPRIGLKPHLISIAPKGVTADELLLTFAVENGLRVVTNDRFLDWREQFPGAGEKGFLVKGDWKQGSVMLRGM